MSRENSANSPPSDGLHIHQHFPLKLSIPKFLTSVMQSAEVKESLIEGSELQVEVRDEGKESFVWLWLSKGDVQRKISAARKVLKEWEKREEVKEVKIFIPSDMVAVIIGKRGRQVASIQDKTHTSISFHDRSPESTPERVVTIEGSPDSISSAIEIIHTTVINHRCYEKKRGKLTVKIERKTEDSGKCREVVGLTDDVMMGGEGYIIIEGSLGECVGPVTRLIELIDSHKSESSQESVVLVTPSRKTTKMNEVMRHMREKLREVELEYTQLDDQETKITLKGDIANRKFAVRSILEAIEHRSRSESGESRHRSRSRSRSSDRTVLNILVPQEFVGRLIGRGGANVNQLKQQSGCFINFQPHELRDLRTPMGREARVCTLTGTTKTIASAVRAIHEQVERFQAGS